jgi:CHAT domain-containing protein
VHDDTAAGMMVDVFRRMVAGHGAAEALRSTMLATRDRLPHPFYWAPFVLLGHPVPAAGTSGTPPPISFSGTRPL